MIRGRQKLSRRPMSAKMLGELSRVFHLEADEYPPRSQDQFRLLTIARQLYFRAKAAAALSIFL